MTAGVLWPTPSSTHIHSCTHLHTDSKTHTHQHTDSQTRTHTIHSVTWKGLYLSWSYLLSLMSTGWGAESASLCLLHRCPTAILQAAMRDWEKEVPEDRAYPEMLILLMTWLFTEIRPRSTERKERKQSKYLWDPVGISLKQWELSAVGCGVIYGLEEERGCCAAALRDNRKPFQFWFPTL